jgi:hypothetical protein
MNPQIVQALMALAQRQGPGKMYGPPGPGGMLQPGAGLTPPKLPSLQPPIPKPQVFDLRQQAQPPQQQQGFNPWSKGNVGTMLQNTGMAMMAQSDMPGSTVLGNLGRSLPAGLQALDAKRSESEMQQAIDALDLDPKLKAAVALLPLAQQGPALASIMLAQGEPEVWEGKEGEFWTRGPDDKMQRVSPAVEPDPLDEERLLALYEGSSEEQRKLGLEAGIWGPKGPLVSTTTNILPGERAYDTSRGTAMAGQMNDIQAASTSSFQELTDLDRMETMLTADSDGDGVPDVYTGAGGELVLGMKRIGEAFGMDFEGVAEGEVIQSLANQMALKLRNPEGGAGMPGALSDKDRVFLTSMVAGLTKSREGNLKIIEARRRMLVRQQEVADLALRYEAEHGRLDDGFNRLLQQTFSEKHMFEDLAEQAGDPLWKKYLGN